MTEPECLKSAKCAKFLKSVYSGQWVMIFVDNVEGCILTQLTYAKTTKIVVYNGR